MSTRSLWALVAASQVAQVGLACFLLTGTRPPLAFALFLTFCVASVIGSASLVFRLAWPARA